MPEEENPTRGTDFADFTQYISLEIPVRCGKGRYGLVYTYSHREHLKNSLLNNYKKELTDLIEKKKYCDSALYTMDLGPTIAVANLIEDGEYTEFIQKFNHGDIQLTGLEHVLKVKEKRGDKWSVHHLMPKSDECFFGLLEQYGVMQYALVKKAVGEKKKIENVDLERANWITEIFKDGNANGEILRKEILEKAKIMKFGENLREYHNCVIYENLYEKIIERLEINQEDVDVTEGVARVFYNVPVHV